MFLNVYFTVLEAQASHVEQMCIHTGREIHVILSSITSWQQPPCTCDGLMSSAVFLPAKVILLVLSSLFNEYVAPFPRRNVHICLPDKAP